MSAISFSLRNLTTGKYENLLIFIRFIINISEVLPHGTFSEILPHAHEGKRINEN